MMKKRLIAVLMALVLTLSVFPMTAIAADPPADPPANPVYYKSYSAIGDSICAGFSQEGYNTQDNGFAMDNNIKKSPLSCYAQVAGRALRSDVNNLGKCGCDSNELLDILKEDSTNPYNSIYLSYLSNSDLISLDIGSNDLIMSLADKILAAAGTSMKHQDAMAMIEPLLKGDINSILAIVGSAKKSELTPEEIQAITEALSDKNVEDTLSTACETFKSNFDAIIQRLQVINPTAQLVILNNYNPYPDLVKVISTIAIADTYIKQMNDDKETYCNDNSLLLVDVSDTPTNGMDPHPTAEGHKEIATGILRALGMNIITSAAEPGGTITPDGLVAARDGDSLTFNIVAGSLTTISDVLVDGASVGPVNTYTFDKINEDHTITAKFVDAATNTITASAGHGGTITPAGQNAVKVGDALTFTIAAKEGYKISDVLVDGKGIGPVSTYAFTDVTADHTITANFLSDVSFDTYTALGDSITAGYGLEGFDIDKEFNNPPQCYVAMAAKELNTKNTSNDAILACDSGDLLNILNTSNDINKKIKNDLKDADLITIDIGSNDLTMTLLDMIIETMDYLEDGKADIDTSKLTPEDHVRILASLGDELEPILAAMSTQENITSDNLPPQISDFLQVFMSLNPKDRFDKAVEAFKGNWDEIVKIIRNINPDATIAALGYYNPYPILDQNGNAYNIGFQSYIDIMNEYISKQSKVAKEYSYVDTTGVELYSTSRSSIDPHPTDVGHADIAGRLVDVLLDNYVAPPNYYYCTIDASASKGGTISPTGFFWVGLGTSKTFTILPDKGYVIDSITVDGKQVAITDTLTFNSISQNHTISVTFKKDTGVKGTKDVENPFTDVGDSWYYDAVMSVFVNDIMSGTSTTLFEPDMTVTRAMFAKILYRMEKEPDVVYKAQFADVPQGEWFTNAVMWAANNDVITGYGNGKFGPNDALTREQMVTILHRFAKYKAYNTGAVNDLSGFADASSISNWAGEAMKWAVAEGLISGTDLKHLSPLGSVSRASIAMLIYRFIDKYWD